MKYPCFAIAVLTALSIGTSDATANLISLTLTPPNLIYGLNVGGDQPASERNGMTWGIVVNTSGSSDFSMLDNSLSAGWFSEGVGTSGQWIGDDLIYLTSETSLPTTLQVGPPPLNMHGGITSLNDIPGTGDNYSLAADQVYSFVIIWFESSIAINQIPSENSRYGYLSIDGFVIPEMDNDVSRRTAFLPNAGNVASLVKTGFFVAVPEPSTYALLIGAMAIGGTAVTRRRRTAAKAS